MLSLGWSRILALMWLGCIAVSLSGCTSRADTAFRDSVGPVITQAAGLGHRIQPEWPLTGPFPIGLPEDVDPRAVMEAGLTRCSIEVLRFRVEVKRLPMPDAPPLRELRSGLDSLSVAGALLVASASAVRRSAMPVEPWESNAALMARLYDLSRAEGVVAARYEVALLSLARSETAALGTRVVADSARGFDPLRNIPKARRTFPQAR